MKFLARLQHKLERLLHWALTPWKKPVATIKTWGRDGKPYIKKIPGVYGSPNFTISTVNASNLSGLCTAGHALDYKLSKNFTLLNIGSDFKVWLYNIGTIRHDVVRPVGKITIPACKTGEKYALATSLPGAIRFPRLNVDSQELDFVVEDGRRVAMDIVNPDNLGMNQDIDTIKFTMSSGADLGKVGVFWSVNNPPLQFEIDSAIKRMKKYYSSLIEQVEFQKKLLMKNYISTEYVAALDYFGKKDK